MSQSTEEKTALDAAKVRFLEALPGKAEQLMTHVSLLKEDITSPAPIEDIRSQLNGLYASCQVFQLQEFIDLLKELIPMLDAVAMREASVNQKLLEKLDGVMASFQDAQTIEQESRGEDEDLQGKKLVFESIDLGLERELTESMVPDAPPSEGDDLWVLSLADRVIHILVIKDVEVHQHLASLVQNKHVEFEFVKGAEDGLRSARSGTVDVVVLKQSLAQERDADWLERLHGDAWTNPVPVILLCEENEPEDSGLKRFAGVQAILNKPVERKTFVDTLTQVIGVSASKKDEGLGPLTLEELAKRLSSELNDGLVQDAELGKDVKLQLGEGEEILTAAWNAIRKVRQVVSKSSEGQVQFRPAEKHGGSTLLSLRQDASSGVVDVSLENKRIFVVDDDSSVVWFIAGLLRENGADVHEFGDGQSALEAAQFQTPDLILSDIVMPELDGFSLCRQLQKDPVLSEVPVIMLSWKEDYLQRMRDLKAGAKGYVRKESGGERILAEVHKVLQARAKLESRLETEAEVRGQVEDVGIITLLKTVAAQRPDSRIVIRDAWNLFEVIFQESSLADLSRTDTDGMYSHGMDVLPQLIGVSSGKFTVTIGVGEGSRVWMDESLETHLNKAVDRLRKVLHAVSGVQMFHIAQVELVQDMVGALMKTSPGAVRDVIQALSYGQSPKDLILSGQVEPNLIEAVLNDLAKRGALKSVMGESGEDKLAPILVEGGDETQKTPKRPSSAAKATQEVTHSVSFLEALQKIKKETGKSEETEKTDAEPQPTFEQESQSQQVPQSQQESQEVSEPQRVSVEVEGEIVDEAQIDEEQIVEERLSAHDDVTKIAKSPFSEEPGEEVESSSSNQAQEEVTRMAKSPFYEGPTSDESSDSEPQKDFSEDEMEFFQSEAPPGDSSSTPSVAADVTQSEKPAAVVEDARKTGPERKSSDNSGKIVFVVCCILMAIFLLWRFVGQQPDKGSSSDENATPMEQLVVQTKNVEENKVKPSPTKQLSIPLPHEENFGKAREMTAEQRARLKPGQGQVQLDLPSTWSAAKIFIDGKLVQTPKGRVPLSAGRHEMVVTLGQRTEYRFFVVDEGKARVIESL